MNDETITLEKMTTDWERQRTLLAKERTFAAIVRTVLSLQGLGIGVAKLLEDVQPAWIAQALGTLLILGGGLLALFGFRATYRAIKVLREEGVEEPRWIVTATSILLILLAVCLLLLVVGLL